MNRAEVVATNIGGIDHTAQTLERGVNVLTGKNATNRTSFLQAVMGGLGSTQVSLKGDADSGAIELTIDGQTYHRRLTRTNGSVSFDGDPYLEDTTVVELFAFLLESNPARRAVEQGDDLRELILRPIDTDEIEREIGRLQDERHRIERELDEVEASKRRLAQLEERRSEITREIEEKEKEREDLADRIAELDADLEASRDANSELNRTLEALTEARDTLSDVTYQLETERESIEVLEDDLAASERALDEHEDTAPGEIERLEDRLRMLREEKADLDAAISDLQGIIQFNEQMLEGEQPIPIGLEAAAGRADDGSVTDRLIEGSSVTCWTCGAEAATEQIQSTVEGLRELRQRKANDRREVLDEVDEVTDRLGELRAAEKEMEALQRERESVAAEIDERTARIEELTERRETVQARIEGLEAEVERLETEQHEELLELHRRSDRCEYRIKSLESDRQAIEDDIAEHERRIDSRAELDDRRSEIADELEDLRTKVDQIEERAVESFNHHMARVLDRLGYSNLQRVWLERVERSVREGRGTTTQTAFELHVVRKTAEGTTYEDRLAHLSESEREVVGLVFALAGYLVHEVHEDIPFLLMDSLEALDSERIAALVEYLSTYADSLVVALLPEDSRVLDDSYRRITEI